MRLHVRVHHGQFRPQEKIMAKLTNEQRSAILSARAKNRKGAIALTAGDVTVPKAVAAHMKAIEDWANKTLAPAKKAAPAKAEAAAA